VEQRRVARQPFVQYLPVHLVEFGEAHFPGVVERLDEPFSLLVQRPRLGVEGVHLPAAHAQADGLGPLPLAVPVEPLGVDKAGRVVIGVLADAGQQGGAVAAVHGFSLAGSNASDRATTALPDQTGERKVAATGLEPVTLAL